MRELGEVLGAALTAAVLATVGGPAKSKHARSILLALALATRLKRWRLETGARAR